MCEMERFKYTQANPGALPCLGVGWDDLKTV